MYRIDNVVYSHFELDRKDPLMNKVRGMRSHDMHSKDLLCVIVDDQFQQASRVRDQVRFRNQIKG